MLNLGNINFGLGVDTRALDNAVNKIRSFGAQVEAAARSTAKGAAQNEAALRAQERAATRALQNAANLQQQLRKTQAPANLFSSNVAGLDAYVARLTKGRLSTLEFQRANIQMEASLNGVRRGLKEHQQTIKGLGENVHPVTRALQALSNAAVLITGPLGGVAARITTLSSVFARGGLALTALVAGMAGAGYVVARLGSQVAKTAIEMDRIRNRLMVVEGTTRAAGDAFNYLVDLADRTGTNFSTIADQFARMSQAVKGTALEGKQFKEVFSGITLISSKFQLTADETAGVLKAFEQMISKGNVQAEELRGQLGDRLVGAFQVAARAMGKTTEELNALIKAGKVASTEFIPKFVQAFLGGLGLDGSERVDSLRASIERVDTAWTLFKDRVDQVIGIGQSMNNTLMGIANALNFMRDHLTTIISLMAAMAGAATVMAGPAIISGIGAMAVGLIRVAAAARAATAAMTAAGFVGTLTQIAAAGTVLGRVGLIAAGAFAGYKIMSNLLGEARVELQQLTTEVDEYIRAAEVGNRTATDTTQEYIDKVKESTKTVRAQLDIENERLRKLEGFNNSRFDIMPDWMTKGLGNILGFETLPGLIDQSKAAIKATIEEVGKLEANEQALHRLLKNQTEERERQRKAAEAARMIAMQKFSDETRRNNLMADALQGGGGRDQYLDQFFGRIDKIEKFREKLSEVVKEQWIVNKAVQEFAESLKRLDDAKNLKVLRDYQYELDGLKRVMEAMKQGPARLSQVETMLDNEAAVRKWREQLEATGMSAEEVDKKIRGISDAMNELAETEKKVRINKLFEETNRELEKMRGEMSAMAGGPAALDQFKRAQEVADAVYDLTKSLIESGVAVDEAKRRATEYGETMQSLVNNRALFEHMQQLYEMRDGIQVFQEAADLVGKYNLSFNDAQDVAKFKQGLEQLGASQQQVNAAVAQFIQLRQQSNAVQAEFEGMKQAIEGVQDAWSNAFDNAGKAIVDGLADGKNFLDSMANIAKNLGKELVGMFLQLSIINPLKNMFLNPANPYPTVTPGGMASAMTQRGSTMFNPLFVKDVGLGTTPTISSAVEQAVNAVTGGGGEYKFTGDYTKMIQGTSSLIENARDTVTKFTGSIDGVKKQIYDYFSNKGLADHQIAGILGTVNAESGFNPGAIGGAGEIGLFQHLGSRARELAKNVPDWSTNVKGQLDQVWSEFMGPENRAFNQLMSSKNVREATRAMTGFERPSGFSWGNPEGAMHWDKRLKGSQDFYSQMGGDQSASLDVTKLQEQVNSTATQMQTLTTNTTAAATAAQTAAAADQAKQVAAQTAAVADQQKTVTGQQAAITDQQKAVSGQTSVISEQALGASAQTTAAQVAALGATSSATATQQTTKGIFSMFMRKGGAFDGGVRFARKGMVMNRPTMFGSANGPVIGGEAGTEAILPLKRDAQGNLGVSAGGGGRPMILNQTINARDMRSATQSRHQMAAMGYKMMRRGAKFA